jgi:hypothetical protein
MSKVIVEAFLSIPPCSGGVAVRRLLKRLESEHGDQVEIIIHTGRDAKMQEYNLNAAPAMVVGDLVKFVGLAPTYECLVNALREAGME